MLRVPLNQMTIGTWSNLATASMETKVYDVIKMLAEKNISAVPIVNSEGLWDVLNFFCE